MNQQLMSKLKIYRVGGYVRDKLLGIAYNDCDYVVVGSTKTEMLNLGFIQIGNYFPVFLHPVTKEEYALARVERKNHHLGHTGFDTITDNVTLTEDLYRRDITINAIAEDLDGNLYDPFNGSTDLKLGIIRHISNAFSEDPLRILRVARFAAKFKFQVAKETIELLKQMSTNLNDLKLISKERILHELDLALSYDYTGEFFYILQITNNLINFFPYLNQYMLKNPNILIQLNNKRLSKMEKYLLLINDNNSIYELALDKKLLNWMHHYLIVNQLLATNRWCSQEVLKICKQLNALRNPQPILLLLKSLKSIKPDFENNIILLDKILRLCICSKPIIPPIASKTEIIQIVNDHYLNLITQIRNSHVN